MRAGAFPVSGKAICNFLKAEWKPALRLRQRPNNPKGKTAHTDPQFKHILETFNGNHIMMQKEINYNDYIKITLNAEG